MSQFIHYQKFAVREEALELGQVLQEKNIPYELETGAAGFDPSFAFKDEFRILLHPHDFEKVNALFTQNIPNDYYLLSFSEKELMEIIEKRDEWSHFDFILAQKILKDRGIEISSEAIENYQEKRISALKTPESNGKTWVIAGYAFAFLGGIFGLFIGWTLLSSKKTLPNGEKIYSYTKNDRDHGLRIVIIAAVFVSIGFAVRLYINIQKQM